MAALLQEKNRARNTSPSMDLWTECSTAQQQLEGAIDSVTKTERLLRENATEVRGQVQSLMSRQQEALRCRELWLLGQIEILEQVKSETLQQQLLQMNRLRGQLDIVSCQLQDRTLSSDLRTHLSSQLGGVLESLSSLSLAPEETPDLCFHGDSRSLRSAITSFGAVTSSAHSPAPKRQKTEDALSDWLLGAGPRPVTVGYQGSKNPQDWLAARSQPQTVVPVLTHFDFLKAWGQLQDLGAWLALDTTPSSPAPNDALSDRGRSSSCSSAFSFEEIDESELVEGAGPVAAETWGAVLRPFEERWESSDWLLARGDCSSCKRPPSLEIENLGLLRCLKATPTGPAGPKSLGHAPNKSPAPSKNQDQDKRRSPEALEAWLQQVAPLEQVCKANERCSSLRSCVCEENCGRDALHLWLLRREGRDKNGVKVRDTPTDEKDTPAEEKNTPAEEKDMPTNEKDKHTILKDTPTAKKMPYFISEREQKVQAILEAWLHPLTSSPAPSRCSPAPLLSDSALFSSVREESCPFRRPLQADQWVLPPKTPTNQTPEPPESSAPPTPESNTSSAHCTPDDDKWLLKKRTNAQELPVVCDLFSCMKLNKAQDQWLQM